MNKNSKLTPHPPVRKNEAKDAKTASSNGPSVDAKGQPVAENDNSANLFEEHIREQENKSQR